MNDPETTFEEFSRYTALYALAHTMNHEPQSRVNWDNNERLIKQR